MSTYFTVIVGKFEIKLVHMIVNDTISVFLSGGSGEWEGTVNIEHNDKIGSVCDDDFDSKDAEVICRMLGYTRYV